MSISEKTIVFVRTSSVARIPVYRHIKSLGARLVVVHPILNPAFEGCFDDWIVHDTNDVDALHKILQERGYLEADAILSFDEYGVFPAALLSERLGRRPIPLSSEALKQTSVKSAFRNFCVAHNINSPAAVAIHTPDADIDALLQHITFPVVIKPSPGAGSLLAKKCTNIGELKYHAKFMWHTLSGHPDVKHLNALGTPVHLLVEEYIGGQEVDVDVAVADGVVQWMAISDNFATVPPFFAETGGVCPSRLADTEQAKIRQLFQSFVTAHGTQCHGVLHFEAKYDFERQEAFVIEVNCRMGSAETNTMILGAYGVQLGECLVRLGLGLPLTNLDDTSSVVKKHCASVNIYPKAEGAVRRVSVPFADKALVDYSIGAQPGTLVALPPKSFFLLCWMVASGPTSDDAVANIQRLTSLVEQDIVGAQ